VRVRDAMLSVGAFGPGTVFALVGAVLPTGGDDVPEHVDRVLGKPPKLIELRATLAELTDACAPQSTPEAAA
jgi:hypothetical protein